MLIKVGIVGAALDNNITLSDWLGKQIGEDRPYRSNSELARAAKLSEKTIRRLLEGDEPGLQTLRKLANGLKYPLEELQRMAGILEDDQEIQDDLTNHIHSGIKRLSEAKKRQVWRLIEAMLDEQEADKKK